MRNMFLFSIYNFLKRWVAARDLPRHRLDAANFQLLQFVTYTKNHSKTVIVMTRIPRMIHGIVQVLVSLWFYYLTRPSRKRIRVTKTPLTPHLYIVKLGFTEGIHYFLIFALKHRLWVRVRTASVYPQSMF